MVPHLITLLRQMKRRMKKQMPGNPHFIFLLEHGINWKKYFRTLFRQDFERARKRSRMDNDNSHIEANNGPECEYQQSESLLSVIVCKMQLTVAEPFSRNGKRNQCVGFIVRCGG